MSDKERSEDLKGGPGHIVLLAVVFAVPVLKLAWTLGGGGEASEALVAMEPSNWPDVLIGMLLNNALLASVLAVVVSRTSYAYFAAKGGARVHADTPITHLLVQAVIVPLTFALVVGAFHGLWWGVAVALVSYALRLGVIVEYRTGRRERGSGRRTGTSPSGWLEHAADTAGVAALLLAGAVLPVIALIGAVDGRSWTSVVECDVNTGRGEERARLVELGRQGNGVVGWDIEGDEVVNGLNCGVSEDDAVRVPLWRS
ncbi:MULTISPECIES: hypothetical protein [unclassified Streptomyces]|uniref:hypothetical protein n=1 Tax=unclassified Streptomyces TaxID=2593676 RepID=UPI002E77300F|nr:hypothetical protein [Streptomyces sp. JV184]MEE1744781.1 hypothetical protein [Streptomyces sp. JV184]